jgi:hypothetical protein
MFVSYEFFVDRVGYEKVVPFPQLGTELRGEYFGRQRR